MAGSRVARDSRAMPSCGRLAVGLPYAPLRGGGSGGSERRARKGKLLAAEETQRWSRGSENARGQRLSQFLPPLLPIIKTPK